jgi:cytochrome c oxidase subunit 2
MLTVAKVSAVGLHYGDPQIAIGVAYAVLVVVFASAFIVIARQAGTQVGYDRVHDIGYWLRNRWLAVLVVLGVFVLGVSFFDLPYAHGSGADRTLVKVTGGQFFWSLQPERVRVGTRVRFDVTSVDVNHSFGFYSPHGHLVGQVQAMPGYYNELDITMNEVGVYRIRCLEYCGLNHATMNGYFKVTSR